MVAPIKGGIMVTLRDLIQAEGAAKSLDELSPEVVVAAKACGYDEAMRLVVKDYKSAAKRRNEANDFGPNRENLDIVSGMEFRRLSKSFGIGALLRSGVGPIPVRALYLHNAASCMAKGNGNRPERQAELNREALKLLESVPEADRDDDWRAVFEKVYFGLSEAGHITFDADRFEATIKGMPENSKDKAGRLAFLAEKLAEAGDLVEAIEILEPTTEDRFSAPNQVERAQKLLAQYRQQKATAVNICTVRGTTREHRAESAKDKTGDKDSSEDHHPIRLRDRCGVVGGMFLKHLKEGTVVAPTYNTFKRASF